MVSLANNEYFKVQVLYVVSRQQYYVRQVIVKSNHIPDCKHLEYIFTYKIRISYRKRRTIGKCLSKY